MKKMMVILLAVIFLWPQLSSAQLEFGTNNLSNISVASTRSIFSMVAGIVNIVLGFLGVLVVLLFLYAGFLWLTSQGNRDRIDQAKKIMLNASIGIGIIFVSYALVNFIFRSAYDNLFGSGGSGGGGSTPPGYIGYGLGGGVLESHYPERGATGVPRNTNIYITFREPIALNTFLEDGNCASNCNANNDNIRLRIAGQTSYLTGSDLIVNFSADHKVFEINPASDLGNAVQSTTYLMELGGGLLTGNNQPVFAVGSYNWLFTVGTEADNTPPQVLSVIPLGTLPDQAAARNTIVQINFSEAVNPYLAAGDTPPVGTFNNIRVVQNLPAPAEEVAGSYKISNQYRTVEFFTTDRCGVNSCGLDIFCLPISDSFTGTVTSNIRDMSGNALDGDANGTGGDDYTWNFRTNSNIDTSAPRMIDMDSGDNWDIYEPIHMTFDKALSGSTVNASVIGLTGPAPLNYWLGLGGSNGNVISINHDPMLSVSDYQISINSAIKDINQNCWYPCLCEGPGCTCTAAGASCSASPSPYHCCIGTGCP